MATTSIAGIMEPRTVRLSEAYLGFGFLWFATFRSFTAVYS